jgi:hypothetical protein
MRLEEDEPEREPFTTADLKIIFGPPVFTQSARPRGGRGEAACESAWNKDPVFGVIGVQTGPP